MDRMFLRLVIFCFCAIFPAQLHAQDAIRDLVVKIHASQQGPDLLRPWTKSSPRQVKGSGVVIDGKRILTNAHVVKYASQIYVQPNQSASHIPARIDAITPGIDLAILKLDDESFFENRGSLSFAQELPRVKDTINVYGYPTGGTELSVTQGIVSRIEYTDYYYQTSGLAHSGRRRAQLRQQRRACGVRRQTGRAGVQLDSERTKHRLFDPGRRNPAFFKRRCRRRLRWQAAD